MARSTRRSMAMTPCPFTSLYSAPCSITQGRNNAYKYHNRLGWVLVMLGAWLAFAPELVHAQFVLYDNFNDERLSPEKWAAVQSGNGGLEIVRQLVSGELHMALQVFGKTTTNTGINRINNRLQFKNGSSLIGVKFKMRVLEVSAQGCAESTVSRTFAGFNGLLFSDP